MLARHVDRNRFEHESLDGFDPRARDRRYRRLRRVLRRRRRLRVGLLQLLYIAVAIAGALVMRVVDVSPTVDSGHVSSLMFSLAGGVVALVALVFSLLFLVVPYANTSLTPRLTLFRDDPIVWRSFSFFIAVFVFLATGGLVVANDRTVSFLVPVIAMLVILGTFATVRTLQFRAYRSLQLGPTLLDITNQGERVLGVLYPDRINDDPLDDAELPEVVEELRWERGLCLLRQVDLPKLVHYAEQAGTMIELRVAVGGELRRDQVVALIRGDASRIERSALAGMVEVGADRTFDQDPLFAFRLLVDIALRALSAAVNDPITAVQSIAGVHELLHVLVHRDLDIGRVGGPDGTLRVVLSVPTWEDYLAVTVDELTPYVRASPQSRRRLTEMVDSLLAEAPPARRSALAERRREIAALSG